MSDEELSAITDRGQRPLGIVDDFTGAVVGGLSAVGRQVDRFTGAPVRAAIGAAQTGQPVGSAFTSQFAKPPEAAPTGKEIAARTGLSTDPFIKLPLKGPTGEVFKVSPAGIAGTAVDIIADPTNIIPAGLVGRVVGKVGAVAGGATAKAGVFAGAKATDVVTGTKGATRIVGAAKERLKATKVAMDNIFNPKISPDFSEFKEIAARNDIPVDLLPEAVEFGPSSIITRASRTQAEGPMGQQLLEKFEAGLDSVREATKKKIEQIGGGTPLNPDEAGALIRNSYNSSVKKFFDDVEVRYGTIDEKFPGVKIAPEDATPLANALNDIRSFAEGRIDRAVDPLFVNQGKQLIASIDAIEDAGGSLQSVIPVLRDVGEVAFTTGGNLLTQAPADVAKMRTIYSKMKDAVLSTITKVDPEMGALLKANNKRLAEFTHDKNIVAKIIGNPSRSDEGVFNALIKNGDTAKIEALNRMLPEQDIKQLKGAFLESMIKTNVDGEFNFKPFYNSLRTRETVMSRLFDANELKDLGELNRLGIRFGSPVISSSGTSAGNAFREFGDFMKRGLFSDALIDRLKAKARSTIPEPSTFGGFRVPTTKFQGITIPLRGGIEGRGKGLQVLSTQDLEANRERRDKVRGLRVPQMGGR
jgi:hypothetical protein